MAYLDQGIGEAYVSPHIEKTLGFSQNEWLEDPVRWYRQIHPDDKDRWSQEAADMFLSGKPLRSAYRVMARDGRVVWFHCEARLVRRDDGRPWFMHGVGFDITELKQIEQALQQERNVVRRFSIPWVRWWWCSTPAAPSCASIARASRRRDTPSKKSPAGPFGTCSSPPMNANTSRLSSKDYAMASLPGSYESYWSTRTGERRLISWSNTVLTGNGGTVTHVVATGIDITERKRLERAVLEVSAREQRRIGQDLHDGLGQHLTGVAFMARVLQDKLADGSLAEASDAAKIVALVNEAIKKTRELARGLLPVVSEARGLMTALERWAGEVSDLFQIACGFECRSPVLIHDETLADHLYYIAHEAVNNAINHGKAKHIAIRLTAGNGGGVLQIEDDGRGFQKTSISQSGLGLRIMNYRANMIGASLVVQSVPAEGTLVSCRFPVRVGAADAKAS